MSSWPASKARRVLQALLRIGWHDDGTSRSGSHRRLVRDGFLDYTWAFHDNVEIGPKMLARIAKQTGLTPDDL